MVYGLATWQDGHLRERDRAMIEVRKVDGKGRGVIAVEDIPAGAVIEIAPVAPFSGELPEELSGYPIAWKGGQALVFGVAQMVNHDSNPNVDFCCDFENLTLTLVADREIKKGEELLIDYDCPLWFTPVGTKQS